MIILIAIAVCFVALTTISDLLGVWVVVKKFSHSSLFRLLEHFAVGTLLGLAFLDLLPEALEGQSAENIFFTILMGIVGFYFLERLLNWNHHMHDEAHKTRQIIVFAGATLEEFVDGVAIGLSVVLADGSLLLPLTTSIAVFAHEFPDSVSRAVAFIKSGVSPTQTLNKVLLTTIGSFTGAVFAVILSSIFASLLPFLAAIAAAAFIYVAVSHLIPDLHHIVLGMRRSLIVEVGAMILGVVLIKLIGLLE